MKQPEDADFSLHNDDNSEYEVVEYQEKDGKPINFYARKTLWLFGAGEAMLLVWLPQDAGASKFKIRFAYLDEADVTALALIENDAERDDFVQSKTDGVVVQGKCQG